MSIYSRSSLQRSWIMKNKCFIKFNKPSTRLSNLINHQPDIDKICFDAKHPYEGKYQHLFNKREKVGLKHYDDFKAFIEYSNDIQDVYKNIEKHNS